MGKNILLISSNKDSYLSLEDLLLDLYHQDFKIFLLFSHKIKLESSLINENNWPYKKIYLGPVWLNSKNKKYFSWWSLIKFYIFQPLLSFQFFFILFYYRRIKKINLIILHDLNEKIIITRLARILGLKVIWLECPGINAFTNNKLLQRRYRKLSKQIKIIAFNEYTKSTLLKIGCSENNIVIINPGIRLSAVRRQVSIFDSLALKDYEKSGKKYFTLGTIIRLDNEQTVENLFQAVKKSLNIITNLQLIIVGEGSEKNNLKWLAKNMEIDNFVWFVGEQKNLMKWLNSFDVYVVAYRMPKINDFKQTLYAMSVGLPVIAPVHAGLDDIIIDEKSGLLVNQNDDEKLAQNIIKLKQNIFLRKQISKNAQTRVANEFSLNNMVAEFIKLLT